MVRIATENDHKSAAYNRKREKEAFGICEKGRFRRAVQTDLDLLLEKVHAADVANSVGSVHEAVVLGHPAGGVLIGGLLVFEAAHQPSAGPETGKGSLRHLREEDRRPRAGDEAGQRGGHISRPQVPEILVGFRLRLWVLAILMDTGINSSRN